MNPTVPNAHRAQLQPLAYSVDQVTRIAPIGKTKVYQLIAEGKLEARKIGKRTLITASSLRTLIGEEAA